MPIMCSPVCASDILIRRLTRFAILAGERKRYANERTGESGVREEPKVSPGRVKAILNYKDLKDSAESRGIRDS